MRFYLLVIFAIGYLAYVSSDACVQCNSATDSKCATNPEQYLAKECANTSLCYTRVLNGDTIRGCASELDNTTRSKCTNEMECLICSFMEGCNRQVFPTHRAQCLQCAGNSTGPCATDVFAKPTVCATYKLGDKCYIRNTEKNTTDSFTRGCLSSAQQNKRCVNERNCYVCEGPGCNFLDAKNDQIPVARDSAAMFGYSLILFLACILAPRYF